MANYLVASGSRKISQLEIATNPVPAGSSSVMPLVIGDSIPITNGTTVQITPDNFLTNLVFDANETYTGANTFSGTNTFSGNNTFTASNNSFNDGNTYFNNTFDSVAYASIVNGGRIELYENDSNFDTLRIRVDSGNGILFEDSSFPTYYSFLEVKPSKGDIHLKRNTVISGSLTVQEVFYVYETASFLNSSGSSKVGDTIDDVHQFTGSILLSGSLIIVDGGTIDGIDLSVYSQSLSAESQSFSSRVTKNENDITLLSGSFEATSSQVFDDIDFLSSSFLDTSASLSVRVTQNEGDISLLSGSYETFSGSQYIADSSSFSADITQNLNDIALLSSSYENFSGSQYQTDSGSFSVRVSQNQGDISLLSGSYENFSGSQYITDSGSVSTRLTNLSSDSSSFSIRVSQNEGDISLLSGSYETFSGSQYQTDSGSFSTRVTNQEGFSSSFDSNVLTYIDSVGVFSGSSQVDADSVTNFDSNVLAYNNSLGVVSGSSQVIFNDTSFNPFISTSAAISASNHFVPSDNEVYDLGTPTQRWRDLYLSGSTIDLGGLLIQKGADGNVQFIDSASQATKSVTIDSITGSLTVTENLTVGGNLTAQQYITEYVSSSILYESGSTKFGDTLDDIHEFTGSVEVSGSLFVDGTAGFGVNTPIRKYHFEGGSISSDTPTIRISSTDSSGTNKFGLEFYSNNGADVRGKILADNNGRVYIDDNGGGGVALQSTGGNVSIGTTSSLATAVNRGNLTINGASNSILAFGTGGDLTSYVYNNGTNMVVNTGDGIFVVESQNVETFYVQSGSVNIKGQNPSVDGAILTLENSDTSIVADQTLGYLNFYANDTSTTSAGGVGGIAIKAETNFDTSYTPTYMSFYTHDTLANDGTTLGNVRESMRLDSDSVLSLVKPSNSGYFNFNGTAMELDVNRHPETGVFASSSLSHARISLNGADGGSEILLNTSNANNTTATTKVRIAPAGQMEVGTASVTSNGITIEKSGNHLFLRATTAPAGEYWNFDIDSNNRLNVINDNSVGVYIDDAATSWTGTSDERLKTINHELTGSLQSLQDIRAVNYSWVSGSVDKNFIGLIAQDVEQHYPEMISEDRDGYKGIRYTEMIPVLVSAIKEQQEIINDLKSRIETLENQ